MGEVGQHERGSPRTAHHIGVERKTCKQHVWRYFGVHPVIGRFHATKTCIHCNLSLRDDS